MKNQMVERPFEYEQCANCQCIDWSWASNERGFCAGHVKNPNPSIDVIRFCLLDKKESDYVDFSFSEALTVSGILAVASEKYIEKLKNQTKMEQ